MRGAHEDDGALLWHFPATPGVHFSEEELYQNGKSPQKSIVEIYVHDGELLASRISLFGRHDGCLDHCCAAGKQEGDNLQRRQDEVGVASYDCWCVVIRGLESQDESDGGG